MGHDHHHSYKNIKLAFGLNFAFTIVELVGGLLTGSVAIQSDAIHDLGDSMTLGFALLMEKLSVRKASSNHSYGFRRLSIMAGIVTGIVLLLGSAYILTTSIPRLTNPVNPNTKGMFALALLGLSVNGFAAWKLSHGDGVSEKILSWHLWEDVLGWAAVLVVSIIMNFIYLPILDPILSIVISGVVFAGAIRALIPAFKILLQATPEGIDLDLLSKQICEAKNVRQVHDFHCWSLDGNHHVASLHVVVEDQLGQAEIQSIKKNIRQLLNGEHHIHTTIEIESVSESQNCAFHECV